MGSASEINELTLVSECTWAVLGQLTWKIFILVILFLFSVAEKSTKTSALKLYLPILLGFIGVFFRVYWLFFF